MAAHTRGVQAKIDRAIEQLESLHHEVLALRDDPHGWTIVAFGNAEGTEHFFRLDPRWEPGKISRLGAIVGEIIHDLRSALDHLAFQLVLLNNATPDDQIWFPLRDSVPKQGFAAATCWDERPQSNRHGPLVGVSPDALAQIERCQPYQGGNHALLGLLNTLWNIDKHRHLLPLLTVSEAPQIEVRGGEILAERIERDKQGTSLLHISVRPTGADKPKVDMQPGRTIDVAFGSGTAVVDTLRHLAAHVLADVFAPLDALFPDA